MVERFILWLRRKRLYRCRECDHRFRDRPLPRGQAGRWPSGVDLRRRLSAPWCPATGSSMHRAKRAAKKM